MLRDKLTALGATVVMTRTTDVNPDNPDMRSRTALPVTTAPICWSACI